MKKPYPATFYFTSTWLLKLFVIVTNLDFILAKNPLSSFHSIFIPDETREKEKKYKKVYQRKETLNVYVRVWMHVINS